MLTECKLYGQLSGDPALAGALAFQEASASYPISRIASDHASAPAPAVKEAEVSGRNGNNGGTSEIKVNSTRSEAS